MTPHEFYDGSTLFQPLSDMSGLSIDKMNFLLCQLIVVLLGFPFRVFLGPHLVSATVRHIVEIALGLWIAYFCFGNQLEHLLLQSTMCLVILRTVPSELLGSTVLVLSMGYLYIYHLVRMVYDYDGSTFDITGPLMISTQRLTSLAFGLQDGLFGYRSEYTETMKKQAIKCQPSLLEFYSYIFCFHGLLCGPFCFYKDYIAFIDGTNYMPPQMVPAQNHLTMKLLTAAVFGLSTVLVRPYFPVTLIMGLEFKLQSFAVKCLLTVLLPFIERHKYYFIWKLGEAANMSCGLGFSGYDPVDGCPQWDLINNADIMRVELATSPKEFLDNFNISTMKWLRYVVYDRQRSMAAVLLFCASWHGFCGGYYLAAFTLLLILLAAQKMRRFVQPCGCCSVPGSPFQTVYDLITFFPTAFCVPYAACAFMILSFQPAFAFYSDFFFWIQALCVAVIILL